MRGDTIDRAPEVQAGDHGDLRERLDTLDWSRTSLGSKESWPQSLRALVRMMLDSRYSMWMGWGRDLTFFYNDAYARDTLGKKHPWALGRPAREVWAEIWGDIGPRIERVLRTGRATWDEGLLLYLERSGYPEETYHTFSYSPVYDDAGAMGGMLCVVTEETIRVIAERRSALLRDLAAELNSVKDESDVFAAVERCFAGERPDLPFTRVFLDDRKGGFRLAATSGPAAALQREEEASFWPLAEVMSSNVTMTVDGLSARITEAFAGRGPRRPHAALVTPITLQGQARPAGVLVAGLNPHRPLDAEYRGFVELLVGQIAAALAGARAYEEERKRAEALAELDRAKTAFFSNVSHEFRTPLTLMLGPLEDTLANVHGELPAGAATELTVAHRNSMRLLKLVNTLLDFSRIEAGRIEASFEPMELGALTAELASVFRSACERAGVKLTVRAEELPERVYVDRDMWEKIVLNLLSNAFKFTFEGEIEVRLESVDGRARLTVRDTGVGIPEGELPRVFERFHRVKETRGRTHEGTGIGLALVQELVRLHGGAVSVESTVGVGTRFTVQIPMGKAHLPADRILAARSMASTSVRGDAFAEEALRWLPDNGAIPKDVIDLPDEDSRAFTSAVGGRVVWADDNADMREYVARLLRQSGFDVVAVRDGREAMEAVRAARPDLVLSDVMMPRLDGFGLLRELRADPSTAGIPVLLLSARAGEEARVEGMQAGADDYLVKPFSAKELVARVEAHLKMAAFRRHADRAVRESERLLNRIVTSAPVAIAVLKGPELEYVSANPACQAARGPDVPLIGRTYREMFPDAAARGAEEAFLEVMRTGRAWRITDFETEIPGREGMTWWEGEALPLPNEQGEIDAVLVLAWEITERKRAESAQSWNARRHAVLSQTAARLLESSDPQSVVEDLCRGVLELLDCHAFFNYLRDDATDRLHLNACAGVPPEEAERIAWLDYGQAVCGCVARDRRRIIAEEISTTDDSRTDLVKSYGIQAYCCHPIMMQGQLIGTLSFGTRSRAKFTEEEVEVMRGVTDLVAMAMHRIRIERAVRESEERFRSLVSVITDVPWTSDAEGAFVVPQPAWSAYTGQSWDELRGHGWSEALHPEDRERVLAAWEASRRTKAPMEFRGRLWHAPSGTHRHVVARATPLLDGDGSVREWVGSCTDVDEQVRAQERLERAVAERTAELETTHQRLRMSERMASLGTLSAGLGHDMGNLLLPLRVRLESLARAALSDQAREDLQAIRTSADYLQKLANSLRLLALDPARGTVREPTVLSEWWTDAQSVMRSVLPRCFSVEADLESECVVNISKAALTQVVFNLVQNAGDAMKERGWGRVTVRARCAGEVVELSITDDGPGMSAEVQARCMEPFFTTKSRGISTGLGLVLVYGLVGDAGGRVEVRSAPGEGTSFILHLPAASKAIEHRNGHAPTKRAVVHLQDQRLRAIVAGEFKAMSIHVASLDERAHDAEVYVLDSAGRLSEVPADAKVVLVGEGNGRMPANVIALGERPSFRALRDALREIAGDGAANGHA